MKHLATLLGIILFWVTSLHHAASAPLTKLTIRSYSDLQDAINQVARTVTSKADVNFGQVVGNLLGMTEPVSLDAERPWQLTVWYEGGETKPLVALKLPVEDIVAFKASLDEQAMLRTQGQDWRQLDARVGLITLGNTNTLSPVNQTTFAQWETEIIPKGGSMIHLEISLSEALRDQLLASLAQAKTSVSQAIATNQAMAELGTNVQAMSGIIGTYFEIFETLVKGVNRLSLGFDVTPDALTMQEHLVAKPNTDLAQWLAKPSGRITAKDLSFINPLATISGAGSLTKNPIQMAYLEKLITLSLQMQNIEPDDPIHPELMDMMNAMLPMNISGAADLTDQLTFMGSYRFPEGKAEDIYARMKVFFNKGLQSMVGEDKMYAKAVFQEKHQVIDGVPVDRFFLTINTNNPLFSMPGQKEQMQKMWPSGEMILDYAVHEDQLLFATADRMKSLLLQKPSPAQEAWAARLTESTAWVGYFNLLSFIKQVQSTNPMIPLEVKEKFSKLNEAGTSLEFQMNIDQDLRSQTKVPMKLLQEFGRLNENP